MGFRDWLSSSSGDDDGGGGGQQNNQLATGDWTHSHYEVKRFESGGNSGWNTVNVGGQKKWGYPISEQEFRANMPELERGKYRLWSVDENGLHHPPRDEEEGWVIEVGAQKNDPNDDVRRELRELRAQIQDNGGQGQQVPNDPEKALDHMKAQLAVSALQSEKFVNQFGPQIALQAFGVNEGNGTEGMGYDEWSDDKLGATLYQLMEDPQKAEQMGQAIGKMGSSFVGGMLENGEFAEVMGADDSSGDGSAEEPAPAEDEPDEERGRLNDLDTGASSFDDLKPPDMDVDEEEVAKNFARAEQARREAASANGTAAAGEQGPPIPEDDEAPSDDEESDTDESETTEPTGFVDVEPGSGDDWPTNDNGVPADPEQPSDLQSMRWQTLQKLGSKHGFAVEEFDQSSLRTGLERELFGTADADEPSPPAGDTSDEDDTDDTPADESEAPPPTEEETKISAGGSDESDENTTPDDIAAQL